MNTRLATLPAALAAVALLSACMPGLPGIPLNPESLVENILEEATGGSIDAGSNVSVPANWPGLPLPEGELIHAMTIDGSFSLTYRVANLEAATKLVDSLSAAGYTDSGTTDFGDLKTYALQGEEYAIAIGVVKNGDELHVSYTVTTKS